MRNKLSYILFTLFTVLLVAVPYAYVQEQRSRTRNFRIVKPGYLYRCGQLNRGGLEKIVHDYGIRTIITFRDHDGIDETHSTWEEEYCQKNRIAFARIPIQPWYSFNGPPPADETVRRFIDVLSNEQKYPRPILMHCYAGLHRTGALGVIYRMEFEGWSNEEAMAEMEEHGYTDIEDNVRWFLERYRPGVRSQRSEVRIASPGP